MLVYTFVIAATLLMAGPLVAQPAPQERVPTFDAASVKPANSSTGASDDKQPSGRDLEKPGRVHYRESLRRLLTRGFDVTFGQIQGPDWLSTSMFVVDAITPPGTSQDQLRAMIQNLLVERFKLASHRETRQLPGYSLVAAKSGPKLKVWMEGSPHQGVSGAPGNLRQEPALGPDGFPAALPVVGSAAERGILAFQGSNGSKLFFLGKTMHELADLLWDRLLRSPVRDATGLTAKYDFSLTYLPDDQTASDTKYLPAPDIFSALQSQLGLRLEKSRLDVRMLVVDHIEKVPTAN